MFSIPNIEMVDKIEPGKAAIEVIQARYQARATALIGVADERRRYEMAQALQQEYLSECKPIVDAIAAVMAVYMPTFVLEEGDRTALDRFGKSPQ